MLSTLDLKVLWRNVCATRGTTTPVAEGLDAFINGMLVDNRLHLQNVLMQLQKGSDVNENFNFLRWASACTYGHVVTNANDVGINCTASQLFSAGCKLLVEEIEPVEVLMHAASHPVEMERLKIYLAQSSIGSEIDTNPGAKQSSPVGLRPSPAEGETSEQEPVAGPPEARQRQAIRLFGSTAAHTLEISDHRRASNFLGVSVVVIESAHPAPPGFDWENKLSIQLTPEEMPEVIAVLLGIRKEAIFSNHGTDRNKSVTFRNQDNGILIVTSRRSSKYSVPVKTSVVYYLLDLFCRAMVEGSPGRSTSDVIATVRGVYG